MAQHVKQLPQTSCKRTSDSSPSESRPDSVRRSTRATSQSEQRATPLRYSAFHLGKNIRRPTFGEVLKNRANQTPPEASCREESMRQKRTKYENTVDIYFQLNLNLVKRRCAQQTV